MRHMIRQTLRFVAIAALLLAAPVLCAAGVAQAQTSQFTPAQRDAIIAIVREALKQDPTILRDAVTVLQQDDSRAEAASHAGLIAKLAPELLHQDGDPIAGNPRGAVTVVEFSDVRCPYCRRMIPTLAQLMRANKDVRIVYKDMPVLGPASLLGARAELAAQRQGGYEAMHQALMTGSPNITDDLIKAAAIKAGLDWARLQNDMQAPDIQARINANLALARQLELQGTPAYIIGDALLPGAVELADLQNAVQAARRAN
jgi:protein-disulfide isomerase